MAVSATMQMQTAVLAKPSVCFSSTARSSVHLVRLSRNANMKVRCMAEEDKKVEPLPSSVSPLSPPPLSTPKPKKVNPSFSNIFAFSGPAPERINGRLAMIGFVSALAVELSNGQDVFAQIANGGVPWFLGTTALLSFASVIPLFKGVSVQSKSNGIMTSDAELLNGRVAMLGLVALIFTEFVKGGALV